MPKPVGGAQRYMPGLDGLRALAVLAVIAYHLELGWAPGSASGCVLYLEWLPDNRPAPGSETPLATFGSAISGSGEPGGSCLPFS